MGMVASRRDYTYIDDLIEGILGVIVIIKDSKSITSEK